MEPRLLQYPFPGHGPARGDRITDELLSLTRKAEVCHMSGFQWNGGRGHQLRMTPSIWGTVLWKNVLAAARADPSGRPGRDSKHLQTRGSGGSTPARRPLPPGLLGCVRW